ncbi:hypothetical protein ACBR19_15775 [Raoultella planticola]
MTRDFNLRTAADTDKIADISSAEMFIFVLIAPRGDDGFLLLLFGGEFPVRRSVQFVFLCSLSYARGLVRTG